jgi:CO/xanthine dehydrogenase Mo-binding subunit
LNLSLEQVDVLMARIGDSPQRIDGLTKVSGAARYTDDLRLPGMMYGATVRSPHAHARIKKVEWRPELAPAGSLCVTAADMDGPNGIQILDDSWPVLAEDIVRHVGEPVALVAAPTRDEARRALDAVRVEYEELEPVLSWEEARRREPLCALNIRKGNVEWGLTEADHVLTAEYETGLQEHIYIEPQAMIVSFAEDETLRVIGSMQCPYYVEKALAHTLGLPARNISVQPAAVGGGFGGKEDFPSMLAIHGALLARSSGRPVKMVYDRHEDIIATTKRHPSWIRHRMGLSADGRLTALDIEVDLDGGAYLTLSPVVLSRGVLHATGPYRCPNVQIRGRVLRTHTAPNGAFRGFGAPQVMFAAERRMDQAARAVGLDPYEIRKRNLVESGDSLATGQVLDESTAASRCLETVVGRTDFRKRWKALEKKRANRRDGEMLRGLGLSLYFHGAGFTGLGEHRMRSPVTVRLCRDGRIEILTAAAEMGQGCSTVLPQMAAAAAGVDLADIVLAEPDTALVPDSGPTVASRTTLVVGGAMVRAVTELRDHLNQWASDNDLQGSFRETAAEYVRQKGSLEKTVRHEPPEWQTFDEETYKGSAYSTYSWGADVIEVEVDPDTLDVHPVKATVACDVGRVIHETLCRGQIEGGTLQAIGYALMEEIKTDKGRTLNDRLATYIVPTFKDSPAMEVHLLEQPWEEGPFGAKGLGELPMDGGAPAVVQAIENATGLVPTRIPATPERLFELTVKVGRDES